MFTSYVLENVLDNNKKIKRQSKMSYMIPSFVGDQSHLITGTS